jgi:hypothetical protein
MSGLRNEDKTIGSVLERDFAAKVAPVLLVKKRMRNSEMVAVVLGTGVDEEFVAAAVEGVLEEISIPNVNHIFRTQYPGMSMASIVIERYFTEFRDISKEPTSEEARLLVAGFNTRPTGGIVIDDKAIFDWYKDYTTKKALGTTTNVADEIRTSMKDRGLKLTRGEIPETADTLEKVTEIINDPDKRKITDERWTPPPVLPPKK